MNKVIMFGWSEGLKKVSLTKLQMELLNISLKFSKRNVDSLLNGENVILEIEDIIIARKFIEAATRIGVNCRLETK